ncbi:MAG: hypothetical protein HY825_13695 [Acidobacteria bacterium]|nr:hypothetical protein [Acidobacteriota bacterium]
MKAIRTAAESAALEDRHRNALARAADDLLAERLPVAADAVLRMVERETGRDRASLGLPAFSDVFLAAAGAP